MDLSFINMPTTQAELLGLLHMTYKAGQQSMDAQLTEHTKWTGEADMTYHKAAPVKKSTFKQWLTRLATQWEDMKHS